MKWCFPIPAMLALTLLAGCSLGPEVVVTDRSGVPVAGALVEPVSASMNHPADTTDAKGRANVPVGTVQEVQWLNVSAAGFKKAHVAYTGGKPQSVVLDR